MSMRENNSATLSRPLGVTAIAVVSILLGCLALSLLVIYLTGDQWQADLAHPSAGIQRIILLGFLCFVVMICGDRLLLPAVAVVSILLGCLALSLLVIYLTGGQWQAALAYPSAGIQITILLGFLCVAPMVCGGGLLCMKEWARRGARACIASLSMFESACVLWYFIYFGSLQDAIALMTAYWGLSIFIAALFIFQLWAWFYLGRREVVARFMLTEGDNMPETADEFLERKIEMKSENYRVQDLQSGKGGL